MLSRRAGRDISRFGRLENGLFKLAIYFACKEERIVAHISVWEVRLVHQSLSGRTRACPRQQRVNPICHFATHSQDIHFSTFLHLLARLHVSLHDWIALLQIYDHGGGGAPTYLPLPLSSTAGS